jgi:hypothetical protein
MPVQSQCAGSGTAQANARRFAAGHRIRLVLASDDQPEYVPAIMGFRHASVGTSSRNVVRPSSRLLLPVLQDVLTLSI